MLLDLENILRGNLVGTFPSISKNKGSIELSFGNIPVWNGVQKIPGVQKCLPMKLSANQGPIAQCTLPQDIDNIVTTYRADDYMFLTSLPGSGNWGNSLGESRLKVVEKVIDSGVPPSNILEIGAGSTWKDHRTGQVINFVEKKILTLPNIL